MIKKEKNVTYEDMYNILHFFTTISYIIGQGYCSLMVIFLEINRTFVLTKNYVLSHLTLKIEFRKTSPFS